MNSGSINELISQGKLKEAESQYRELMEATLTPVTRQFARARIWKYYNQMKKDGKLILQKEGVPYEKGCKEDAQTIQQKEP